MWNLATILLAALFAGTGSETVPYLKEFPSDLDALPIEVRVVGRGGYETRSFRGEAQFDQKPGQQAWVLPLNVSSACQEHSEVVLGIVRSYLTDEKFRDHRHRFTGELERFRLDFLCTDDYLFMLASEGGVGNHGTMYYDHLLRIWLLADRTQRHDVKFFGYHDFTVRLKDDGEQCVLEYSAIADCDGCRARTTVKVGQPDGQRLFVSVIRGK